MLLQLICPQNLKWVGGSCSNWVTLCQNNASFSHRGSTRKGPKSLALKELLAMRQNMSHQELELRNQVGDEKQTELIQILLFAHIEEQVR